MPPRCPVSVALVLIGILVSLPVTAASAQQGVTTFTGLVTINGEPAPEETLVRITLEDGGLLGSTLTGFGGLKPNEYSLEIKSDPAYAGKKVLLTLPRVANSEPVVAAFEPNTVIVAHVAVFSVAPTVTPTGPPKYTITAPVSEKVAPKKVLTWAAACRDLRVACRPDASLQRIGFPGV